MTTKRKKDPPVIARFSKDADKRIKQLQAFQKEVGLSDFLFLGTMKGVEGGHLYMATEMSPIEVLELLYKTMHTILQLDVDFSEDSPKSDKLH